MAANYLPYEPQQMMLLPESLQEWLPEGHLAHFINDAIDGLDLGAFHARYDKDGPRNQPFHPVMMVKVLVYGDATGVLSSRKIARLAREMGLVTLGTIAVDGTKVKANANRHKAMSYGHMLKAEAELKAQIETLLNKARAADEAEKNEAELDLPAEIARRQDRLDAIAAARTRLEQRQRQRQRQRDADLERGRSDDGDQKPRGQGGKPKPEGRTILQAAVTQPGVMNQACRAFHNYSIHNQPLAALTIVGHGPAAGAQRQLQRLAREGPVREKGRERHQPVHAHQREAPRRQKRTDRYGRGRGGWHACDGCDPFIMTKFR